ncbi:MAG TPA: efflux RND transporter periplasmic adaptor subunit [Candidatus Acidoferrum sp.]|nr:efflux RND transporter periplasmic adaptor subunit [Candidatus Acidoferrum sp.]
MKLQRKALLAAAAIGGVVSGMAGCGDAAKVDPPMAQQVVASDSSASATTPRAAELLVVTAPLIVEHQVDVTAQRDGIVAAIAVEAGARVSAGTILAKLDDRQLNANLEAARAKTRGIAADLKNWQAEAEVLKADYVRAQRLYNEKLIAEEQLQHAQYKAESDQWDILRVQEQLNTAKEEEHSLELELEKTRIMAPFAGLVARRYVRSGQTVAKGERLFWVTEEGPLRVRFTLPEKFIGHVKKGQEMALTSPDLPNEKHSVKVVEVSPVVDPSSGTIELLAELSGPRGELRPGMNAAVHVPNLQ